MALMQRSALSDGQQIKTPAEGLGASTAGASIPVW